VSDTTKTCTNCGEVKPATLEFFYKKSGNKTYGLKSHCKPCCSKYQEANREKHLERVKQYQKANREKILKYKKHYRETNREELKKRKKQYYEANRKKREQYYEANREELNRKHRERRALNPEKTRESGRKARHKRRALKLNNGHSPYSETEVLAAYGTACHICGVPIDLDASRQCGVDGWENGLHIDHLQPISKGGPDTLKNVRPAHGKCNVKKGNKTLN